ncbi:hypothetical protein [Aerosakkonema funiforme]|uniref:hypothetical protein n=1 Tax=Aerosakkonema funiforme TaxID=1246630 RepID=UPI0035B82508
MDKLFYFLTDLATNPRQQQAFAKDPDSVMDAAGLSEWERALVKNRNSAQITANFADPSFQAALSIVDPAPDPLPDPDPPSEPPDSDSPEGITKVLALVV